MNAQSASLCSLVETEIKRAAEMNTANIFKRTADKDIQFWLSDPRLATLL